MKKTRMLVALAATAALTIGLSACTAPGDSTSASGSAAASVKPLATSSKDLKVAFFQAGSSNSYLQANISAAKDLAAKLDVPLDVFDAQWDAQTQANQIQSAITSGKYNAFMILPVDGNLICDSVTKDAIPSGIMVSILNVPICGLETETGDATRAAGTVTFVGGQTAPVYDAWVDLVIKDHPDGGTIGLIAGPDLSANTVTFFNSAKKLTDNKFTIVGQQTTDYTTPKGYAAAQAMLSANPNLTVIMSNYSGVTQGVVQAVADAGRTGTVDVYDVGGDSWGLDQVKSGTLKNTVMLLPKQETADALQALADQADGKPVQAFYNLAQDPSLPGGTPLVTSANVNEYTAEY